MNYRQLGDSELRVSELCLGTMTFGEQNTLEDAKAQLDRAFDAGINFVDAAEMYPVPTRAETQGRTESYIGEWLSQRPRDKVVLATKIAGPGRPIPWVRNGSLAVNRANVRRAVEDSLRRLRTDYIDLYQIHWPDRYVPQFGATVYDPANERSSTPIEEQLAAFAEVIRDGKVRYIGLSNETPWGVTQFSRVAERLGLPKPVSIQNAYSLINRTFDSGLAEASRRENVPLLAYSPLGFGLLTGKYLGGPPPGARLTLFETFGQRYRKPNVDEAVQAYVKLARANGLTPASLALAFVRSRWFVASTIIGATTLEQLEENIRSAGVVLGKDVLAEIDQIHARYPNPAP
ncbi:NADP(H)-dependent aldo-keto reductase [Sorangium sp. So ce1024]|uniref:NADP(H)-dependent aldo-keto reductase n=1 Tax=unclassified Sorangium TaxID=2621164 RepID=UPI003EFE98D1